MTAQDVTRLLHAHIPHHRALIERPGDQHRAGVVEVAGNHFRFVVPKAVDFLRGFRRPHDGRRVHRSGADHVAVSVELSPDDLARVSPQSVQTRTRSGAPNLRRLVETAGHDFITFRVVEGDGEDDVLVALQDVHLVAGLDVPNAAGSVVAARYALLTRPIEVDVRERQDVSLQRLVEIKFVLLGLLQLVLHLLQQLLHLRQYILGENRWFLLFQLPKQVVEVTLGRQVENVDALRFLLAVVLDVIERQAGWEISQENLLQLHR